MSVALVACSSPTPDTTQEDTSTAQPSGGSYSVTHAMGATEFSEVPERIVVLDSPQLDALVSLGLTPVGAPVIDAERGFPDYLADQLSDVTPVGSIAEPDVDAIAALAPDLILGSKVRHEALYPELSAIAPTVYSEDTGTNWTEQAVLTAAAVNQSEEMDVALDALKDRAAEVGEEVGAAGRTASIVRFRPDNFRLYGPGTFSGSLLTDMGFDVGSERVWNEWSIEELSPELFTEITGDVIFYTTPGGDPAATTAQQITELWGDLPAVSNGRAFPVDDDTWMIGIGVLGADIVVDQVEELLGDS